MGCLAFGDKLEFKEPFFFYHDFVDATSIQSNAEIGFNLLK